MRMLFKKSTTNDKLVRKEITGNSQEKSNWKEKQIHYNVSVQIKYNNIPKET